jgi:hypothetical protein
MPPQVVQLSVDIGAWWTAAVLYIDGQRHPVAFDGQPRIPSGIWIDPATSTLIPATAGLATAHQHPHGYVTDPLARLHTDPTPEHTDGYDPTAGVSTLLAYVANTASLQAGAAITALAVVTPQAWGPRSRDRLSQAATLARLPTPHIVTAAAAAAAIASSDAITSPSGAYTLVCATADAGPTITILDAGTTYTQLAVADVRDPHAPAIDQALTDLAWERAHTGRDTPTPVLGHGWQTAAEIHHARTVLATQPRAPILLPEPYPAVVIDRDDLTGAAKPHLDRLDDTIDQALTDADLDHTGLTATVVIGDDATLTALHTALSEAGPPPAVITGQPYALADGAARLTHHHNPTAATTATAATTRLPRTRLTVRSLAATAILAVCSIALLSQVVATADISTIGATITGVRLATENVSLAAALAALAAISVAHLAPTTWLTPAGMADETSTGILLRRSYLAAAATGLALAGLWGLGVGVGVGYTSGSYLRWALITAAPIAACAALIALVSPRIPAAQLPTWLTQLRPPAAAIALATVGIYLIRSAFTLTIPTNLIGFPGAIAAAGGALLGLATAGTATRQPLIRAITGCVLALGYALVTTVTTAPYLTITYITALIWWTLSATIRTIQYATPGATTTIRRWLNRQ